MTIWFNKRRSTCTDCSIRVCPSRGCPWVVNGPGGFTAHIKYATEANRHADPLVTKCFCDGAFALASALKWFASKPEAIAMIISKYSLSKDEIRKLTRNIATALGDPMAHIVADPGVSDKFVEMDSDNAMAKVFSHEMALPIASAKADVKALLIMLNDIANTFAAYDRAVNNEAASAILWGVAKRAIYTAVAELVEAASETDRNDNKERQQKKASRRARKFLLKNKKADKKSRRRRKIRRIRYSSSSFESSCSSCSTSVSAAGCYPYTRVSNPRYPGGKIPVAITYWKRRALDAESKLRKRMEKFAEL